MGHGPVTVLDVWISSPSRVLVIRSREGECVQAKQRDSVVTGRHVQTAPSTSPLCGGGDSLQQHNIIRIPHFIMETSPPPSSLTLSST